MTKTPTLSVIVLLALTIAIAWIPNQFQLVGIQEEWRYRAPFDGGVTTYNDIGSDSSEEQFFTRPMYGLMNALSFIMFPESFIGHHVILITLLLVKGIAMFLVFLALFPQQPLWGFFCAFLLIFYPSDAGIISFRTFHHHLTIVGILFSIYFFVRYYQSSKRRDLFLMGLSQLVAALSAETGYPVFFMVPITILLLEKQFSRRFFKLTTFYYIIPAITFAYSIYLILGVQTSWQSTALTSYTVRDYLRNIYRLYEHNFFHAWRDIVTYFTSEATQGDVFVFVATVLTAWLGAIWIMRQSKTDAQPTPSIRTYIIVIGLAGIAVLAGYGMFLVSRTHVLTDFRVYLLSSIGLATVFGTVVYALYIFINHPIGQYIVLFGFSVLVGLSAVFANKTHNEFLDISNTHENMIRQITDAVPALSEPAFIVIKTSLNEVNYRANIAEIQKPVLFTPMLQVVYNDYEQILGGIICFKEYLTCDFLSPDGMDIQASNFLNLELPIPYDQMILFNITKDEEFVLITEDETLPGYNPMALIDSDSDPPLRVMSIYGSN